jgi:ectoine hydroxylase-related dioxygenase (phytanoyl-CoA dioxygenase family)
MACSWLGAYLWDSCVRRASIVEKAGPSGWVTLDRMPPSLRDEVDRQGFSLLAAAVDQHRVAEVARALDEALPGPEHPDAVASRGVVFALRHAERLLPAIGALGRSGAIAAWIAEVLGEGAVLVGVTLFDKHPDRRWALPWHRDVVFGREGDPRWRAPTATLERMLAARLHLDDASEANGCLALVRGSHRAGADDRPVSPPDAADVCTVPARAGDVLFMRPLALHRSARGTDPTHRRRILHFDFAAHDALPPGLTWACTPTP